jgi:acyl dehydratase
VPETTISASSVTDPGTTEQAPPARVFAALSDFAAAVGQELGTTPWRVIGQEQVNTFADATDDHQWIHVDSERAAKGPFGAPIAHGFLTLSLLPSFLREVYRVEGLRMGVNYGLDSVRFPGPVPVGSPVRATVTLVEATETESGLRSRLRVSVEREGADKPVCVADFLSLMRS